MELIPNWQDLKLPCYFCGTKQSVKYQVELPTFGKNIPGTVCACNKCALARNKLEAK